MMAIILSFLKNHWISALGGALVIAIFAELSLQQFEITHLHKEIVLCSAEKSSLQHSNDALVSSIQKQNAAILLIQAQANRKLNAAQRAVAKAKIDAKKYTLAAQKLKMQNSSGDECADMRSVVDNYIKSAQ